MRRPGLIDRECTNSDLTPLLVAGADGSDRTLYSLRHTSLMQQGGDVYPLIFAKNARTSMEMLERFYLSKIGNEKHRQESHAEKPGQRHKQNGAIFRTPVVINVQMSSEGSKPKQNADAKAEAVRRAHNLKRAQ